MAGANFDELTSNAKTLAEDFRDNFENHKDFAKKDKLGWRNENYGVYGNFAYVILLTSRKWSVIVLLLEMEKCPVSGYPILEMERCVTKFFGIKTYGVHVNCFFRNQDGQICLWIGRRSPTKETWPGLLDNCFAGKSFWVNMGSFKFMKVNFRWLYSRFGYYGNSC